MASSVDLKLFEADPAAFLEKAIISDFHLNPLEVLERHLDFKGCRWELPSKLSVISFVLPVSYQARLSLRKETAGVGCAKRRCPREAMIPPKTRCTDR